MDKYFKFNDILREILSRDCITMMGVPNDSDQTLCTETTSVLIPHPRQMEISLYIHASDYYEGFPLNDNAMVRCYIACNIHFSLDVLIFHWNTSCLVE